jgi:hypothetical protein
VLAEAAGQEDSIDEADIEAAEGPVVESDSNGAAYIELSHCDFINEKPMIQHFLEARGHVCIFYPKFHCELNPIEMLWGYGKHREFGAPFPHCI